jgi:alkanesulfonate monooxygenase SsuD/methylene tetrahydromethanopterin reductase-like flavin-dependent oxidoreductase (luciferase family)
MVTSVGYRHPAVLAKMAATVDVISDGRLEFGIVRAISSPNTACMVCPFCPRRSASHS